jgi:hypothetical protein
MTSDEEEEEEEEEKTRLEAVDAVRCALQFLESGQATGAFVLLTNDDRAIMWEAHITPSAHPIGDAANVLAEMGDRLRQVWYGLVTDDEDGRGFLKAIKDDE